MNSNENKGGNFEYRDFGGLESTENRLVIKISSGINSKSELLTALAKAIRFPEYFGENWDALEDCLRDLSWIKERELIIYHGDLPLWNIPNECRVYLEILQCILDDWNSKANSVEFSTDATYVDHEIRVVFPSCIADVVDNFLEGKYQ
ncbi:barstar family protein [Acidovorax sp. NCPPB 4044]|uniref:barstar family protein n=1 Tax=Acidovorax sp. NCPPB 4044 TaxID=2940490 RepID=UPI002304B804|nr:barstar family protein [Acidovorax sp. NCPPB 4044]MDA8523438.1 barstar family protein [Acidovorax sp. NCPPB 4044]